MMTSNNLYKEEIDFAELALQDSDFSKVLKFNGQLDFSNPESVKQLTKTLLKIDFGLNIEIPHDRLCPPVPNRLNYLLWIQSLLDTTSTSYSETFDPKRKVLGLDIGTGASCIYPLLGCTQRAEWRFAGTDIDDKSLHFARQNIKINNLEGRVKLHQSKSDGPLLPLDDLGFEEVDFSMCNPPFYESKSDMLTSAASKQRPPFTVCTGSETEMVTPGGEVAFIFRIITESLILQHRVQWYTSMLGKFSSLRTVIEKLKDSGISNYAVTEFVQGSKTRRWGIGWSHDDMRPSMSIARGVGSLPKAALPFPSEYTATFHSSQASALAIALNDIISKLPLQWMWKANIFTGLGFSPRDVWSRSARRLASSRGQRIDIDEDADIALGFKIIMEGTTNSTRVVIRWLKGHDPVIYESFCGMIKRKLEEVTK